MEVVKFAVCGQCGNYIPGTVLHAWDHYLCLDCLRAAVALLEGQQGQAERICWLCDNPLTNEHPGHIDGDGDAIHNDCRLTKAAQGGYQAAYLLRKAQEDHKTTE